jgi:signal transduction histidine kinase
MAHKALLHSFYSKLAVALIISFVLIGLLLVLFIQQLGHNYQSEVEQKLHLNLASHLVDSKSILTDGEIDNSALKDTFHTMMILGPSFEFYLLDTEGNILTYDAEPGKIKREQVDLSPIHAFLNNSETLPIWGDDPRHDHRKKIFSVTEITNEQGLQGYLYIIIGGELYDGVVNLMKNSHIATIGLWLMGAAILFSMLVTLLLFGFLTRPLRKLSQEMTLFSQKGFEKVDQVSQNSAHWNPDSPDEIERLGANFHKMADALGQQYEHIKSTDELRRELISYVSHDLRTPLASLQGYLETWQLNHQNMDQAESASLIDIALKNSQQVSRLVEQLFELAHLDSHTLTLEKEPVVITHLPKYQPILSAWSESLVT